MNKEQASEEYIKGKLRDSNDYLGCEERRRMTLIQSDMYTVQQAFEDGWDEAKKTMIEKACKWMEQQDEMIGIKEKVSNFIYTHFYKHPHVNCHICTDSFESVEEMESDLIKAMEDGHTE